MSRKPENGTMRRLVLISLCLTAFSLAACTRTPPPLPMPTGVQTMTGVLVPTDLGLLKRGTHILRKDGADLALVESSTINLHAYENRAVGVSGVFEKNADPSQPPVLVVASITPVEEEMQNLSIPSLSMTCQVPEAWMMTSEKGGTRFLLEGVADPIVTIAFDPTLTALPSGTPFLLDGKHAIRTSDAIALSEKATVDLGAKFLTLQFHPPKDTDTDVLRAQWLTFLTSVHFTSSGATSAPATGSGSGVPCGGTAGILCHYGEYCAITDFKENIGHCKLVR